MGGIRSACESWLGGGYGDSEVPQFLQDRAGDRLAVGVGGGLGLPRGLDIGGAVGDLRALGGCERRRPCGGEARGICAQLLPGGECLLLFLLGLAHKQAVLGFCQVVAAGAFDVDAGALQALAPDAVHPGLVSLEVFGSTQGDLNRDGCERGQSLRSDLGIDAAAGYRLD